MLAPISASSTAVTITWTVTLGGHRTAPASHNPTTRRYDLPTLASPTYRPPMTQLTASQRPTADSGRSFASVASRDSVAGMTKQVTISLPDDVAEFLSRVSDASEFVADAVRRRMIGEQVREELRAAGFNITDEGVAEARAEIDRLRRNITPKLRAEAAALYAEVMRLRAGGHV